MIVLSWSRATRDLLSVGLVRSNQARVTCHIGSVDRGKTAGLAHAASPTAKRRPDKKSSRCSGFRRKLASGTTTGEMARSRSTIDFPPIPSKPRALVHLGDFTFLPQRHQAMQPVDHRDRLSADPFQTKGLALACCRSRGGATENDVEPVAVAQIEDRQFLYSIKKEGTPASFRLKTARSTISR